jgi:hypothetical protein
VKVASWGLLLASHDKARDAAECKGSSRGTGSVVSSARLRSPDIARRIWYFEVEVECVQVCPPNHIHSSKPRESEPCFLFRDSLLGCPGAPCSSYWPGTCDLSISASQVLGLQASTTSVFLLYQCSSSRWHRTRQIVGA